MFLNLLVHPGLRRDGVVHFVVAVAPVSHQIDQEIFPEPAAVRPGQPDGGQTGLRIVRVDMNHRNFKAFGQIAGVSGGPGIGTFRGEPQLVVGDDMNRPPRGVTPEPA